MLNLAAVLETSARRYPDREAVVFGGLRWTYREVNDLSNQVANLLTSLGTGPGSAVCLSSPNIPHFPIVYFGALKTGASIVPLNVLLKHREIAFHLRDSGASTYFCFQGSDALPVGAEGFQAFTDTGSCQHFFTITADAAADSPFDGVPTLMQAIADQPRTFQTVSTAPDDTAVILYTSGTTGHPKGAELSHSNMVMNALTCNWLFDTTQRTHDSHLVALPLFHSFGQTVHLNAGFASGATLTLIPRFDAAQAISLMQSEGITLFAGVPTMYWGLLGALDESVDVEQIAQNLRLAISGGSALPPQILEQVQQRLGVQVLEGYGLSETSPVAAFSDPSQDPRPGSIGVPIWGVDLALIDDQWRTIDGPDTVGEIAVRGHNVMKGYYKRPEESAEVTHDGWLRTGDLARRDADGFYYIVDRAKDLIIRGGFNVYPREVEDALMEHEDISLAAVVGVPDDVHGEEVKAYVILREGASLSADDIVSWSRRQMAAHKYPRTVQICESLPMTATGKILKRELADL